MLIILNFNKIKNVNLNNFHYIPILTELTFINTIINSSFPKIRNLNYIPYHDSDEVQHIYHKIRREDIEKYKTII